MSFVEFLQPDPQLSREQVMAQLIQCAALVDMPNQRDACIIAGITVSQEAGARDDDPPNERRFWCPANHADEESFQYQHDSVSDDGRSVGYFQQQKSAAGALWWGTTEQEMRLSDACSEFMRRLKKIPHSAAGAQQANDAAQAIQGSGFPNAYAQHFDDIVTLYNRVIGSGKVDPNAPVTPPPPSWRGDPVWLNDVVAAEGVRTAQAAGWLERGHGDFGKIWGVMFHHTGGDNTPVSDITHHPQLGLCSQIHLAKDGLATMCGVGIAWHAGIGSYPGVPEDGGNGVLIGVECVNLPPRDQPHRTGWGDVQYDAIVRTFAAILRRLGQDASHAISHAEYAGRKQGKWDPGSIDMNIFRADVAAQIGAPMIGDDDMGEPRPSLSIYRTPGETWKGTGSDYDRNIDAMTHQRHVESLAITYGDLDSISRIRQVARGEGADPNDAWAVQHAKAVFTKIPKAYLQAWKAAQT